MSKMATGMIKLQEELHNKILNLRSIEAMIRRPQFERLWEDSSENDKEQLRCFIKDAKRRKVVTWIETHPSLELGEKKLTVLKNIATRLGIKNISRMGKVELVREIESREKNGTQ